MKKESWLLVDPLNLNWGKCSLNFLFEDVLEGAKLVKIIPRNVQLSNITFEYWIPQKVYGNFVLFLYLDRMGDAGNFWKFKDTKNRTLKNFLFKNPRKNVKAFGEITIYVSQFIDKKNYENISSSFTRLEKIFMTIFWR